jgi:hypothetical protein
VGHDEPAVLAGQCVAGAHAPKSRPPACSGPTTQAGQALRVTYPVRNEARCGACHGPVSQQPVNGVLVLDFSPMAGELLARQRAGTWLLPASLGVLALLGLAAAWVLRREVLRPVAALSAQVDRLAGGDLQARSGVHRPQAATNCATWPTASTAWPARCKAMCRRCARRASSCRP